MDRCKHPLIYEMIQTYKLGVFRKKFRRKYPSNDMIPMNVFPLELLTVGKYSYGELNVTTFANNSKLIIGNYVSIAQNVRFMLDVEHNTSTISTFPFKNKVLMEEVPEAISNGDIIIEDDVWIGYGSTILSGVHIGQGSVVASGSIVTKDVEPYSIVGGIPAKEKRKRFDESLVQNMLEIDYKRLSREMISEHIHDLYMPCKSYHQIEWLPKKQLKNI